MSGPPSPAELDRIRHQSGLRIDRQGRWHFRGALVENDRVQHLFHTGVRRDASSGAITLHVGDQWAYVQFVDDVAFFVERIVEGQLRLLTGEQIPLVESRLETNAAGDLHATLPDGRRARLLRLAMLDLEPLLETGQDGIVVAGPSGRQPVVESPASDARN